MFIRTFLGKLFNNWLNYHINDAVQDHIVVHINMQVYKYTGIYRYTVTCLFFTCMLMYFMIYFYFCFVAIAWLT